MRRNVPPNPQAATHGCIRLDDDAIAYLYRTVPVGTPVYIF